MLCKVENFAFSYNITALTEPMRKALNRERTNVGRTTYTDRVKQILPNATASEIAEELAGQLQAMQSGSVSDEVRRKEVYLSATSASISRNGTTAFNSTSSSLVRCQPVNA